MISDNQYIKTFTQPFPHVTKFLKMFINPTHCMNHFMVILWGAFDVYGSCINMDPIFITFMEYFQYVPNFIIIFMQSCQ